MDSSSNTSSSGPGTGRYAAYDKAYKRFVGGVHDSSEAAAKAAKDAKVRRYEIREV